MTKCCSTVKLCPSCLDKVGTRILRRGGYNAVGARKGKKDPRQWAFDRQLVLVGNVGLSTKRRRR